MWTLLFTFFLGTLNSIIASDTPDSDNWVQTFLPKNYSATSEKVDVSIQFELNIPAILTLSPKDMEFSIDAKLRITWVDKQLGHINENGYKILPVQITSKLTIPYLEFTNCKACNELIVGIDEIKKGFIFYQGSLIVSYRGKLKFNCIFDLSRYPFDKQYCEIVIKQTIWHGKVDLPLEEEIEKYKKIDRKSVVMPPEFKLKKLSVEKTDCYDGQHSHVLCFTYKFTFERTILQNMLLVFVPSILIVMLSWISFWLDVEAAAPRVTLGQTSLLTLAAQFNAVQGSLPPVSTVKAIDVWMFACMSMSFASLLEFAVAYNFKSKKIATVTQPIKIIHGRRAFTQQKSDNSKRHSIDFWAKIIFPVIFLLFNIVFWLYYLYFLAE